MTPKARTYKTEKVAQARSILEEAAATVVDQFTEPHAVRLLEEYIDQT